MKTDVHEEYGSPDAIQLKKVAKPSPKKTELLAKVYAADWLAPAGLIALCIIPVAAGTMRLAELAGGAEITPDNARFFAAPLPVVLHIVSASLYCVLGVFQFSAGFRRRNPDWHRAAGRILVTAGIVAALSGLWLTQFYPPVMGDGPLLYGIRLVVGSAMTLFIVLGVAAIRRRDIARHRAWMMRSYALGLGAGTQALTHLPWFLFPGIQGELTRALLMGAGWAINLAVAECIIRRRPAHPTRTSSVAVSHSREGRTGVMIIGDDHRGGSKISYRRLIGRRATEAQ